MLIVGYHTCKGEVVAALSNDCGMYWWCRKCKETTLIGNPLQLRDRDGGPLPSSGRYIVIRIGEACGDYVYEFTSSVDAVTVAEYFHLKGNTIQLYKWIDTDNQFRAWNRGNL